MFRVNLVDCGMVLDFVEPRFLRKVPETFIDLPVLIVECQYKTDNHLFVRIDNLF